ncbi:MAG: hypothetical protein A2Z91_08520 [Deltaproteobacteria bacterium GWA2_38_16]|nr:MAG: hypothetical protein A2Z91_08520 [Deltaproteobacteria bacterium GWA2_38_16]OGQ03837.1 MAG: hypothetical protein A3D19_07085 [Deltaproteobacteria bacterium RIFCSPHIGHO2_02_FULL_38_15]OGQ63922.1 MAG: hypothetical protein A3G92_08040 [Deltaproteobacteria bacterium RIFCSPLOWO2_12_FULL_38_8]HBQ20882.1 3-hydroxyacyl-[acyl-carrier-protein] dehydratase FabZ [Deltaproteobacteria bacterium]
MTKSHQFTELSPEQIRGILPHRYPFLLVDRISEVKISATSPVGDQIVGYKGVTQNELFFQGHFPDRPVMPGVLIIEALAQVSALLIYRNVTATKEDFHLYLGGIDGAKFRKPVLPGNLLRLEATVKKVSMKKFFMTQVKAFIVQNNKEDLVAEASLSSAIVLKEPS